MYRQCRDCRSRRHASMDLAYIILVTLTSLACALQSNTVHQTMVMPTPYGAGLPDATFSCIRSSPDTDLSFHYNRPFSLNFPEMPPNLTNSAFPDGTTERRSGNWRAWYLPASAESAGIYQCGANKGGRPHQYVYSIMHSVDRRFEPADGRVTRTVNVGENVTLSVTAVNNGTDPNWSRIDGGLVEGCIHTCSADGPTAYLTRVTEDYHGDLIVVAKPTDNVENYNYNNLGMVRLIVRGCAGDKWGPPNCTGLCDLCYNGGVCDDNTGECICAPGFRGTNCLTACGKHRFGWDCEIECGPGNHIESCTGTQFGLPDPYGQSCISGYTGRDCDIECSKETFGAGCTQTCKCLSGECDGFTGKCTGSPGGCKNDWYGPNCQVPVTCPPGRYGDRCTGKCLCFNDTYCGRDTDDCQDECHQNPDCVVPPTQEPPQAPLNIVLLASIGGGLLIFVIVSVITLVILYKVEDSKRRHKRRRHRTPANSEQSSQSMRRQNRDIVLSLDDYEEFGQVMSGCPSLPYENVEVGLPPWASRWGIPFKDMIVGDKLLGEGQFGDVLDGAVKVQGGVFKAAIKMLEGQASETKRHKFMKEFQTMTSMHRHPNVIALLGACQFDDTLYVALEYLLNGDLRTYLRQARVNKDPGSQSFLAPAKLLGFAVDVARGMSHLAASKVIHGDLAARNVLLDSALVAKISDFGLSRGEDIYVKSSKTRISTRWLPLESLTKEIYTSQSDVWSFGVVMWEILTLGGTPYNDITSPELVSLLQRGRRLPKPSSCDGETFKVMRECWQEDPKLRPTFTDLVTDLVKLAQQPDRHISSTYQTGARFPVYVNIRVEYDDN